MSNTYIKNGVTVHSNTGSVVIGDKRIFNPTDAQLLEDGWVLQESIKPSVEQLIQNSDKHINRDVDRQIRNGFTWAGEGFYLTLENQFNYKNLYDLRSIKSYPVVIKTRTGFMQLENENEVSDFYLAVVNYIDQCLKDGWVRKAEAADKIRKEFNKQA